MQKVIPQQGMINKDKTKYSGKSTSRGGITCAHGWFDEGKKHEIKKGDTIFWLTGITLKGKAYRAGYCGYCLEKLFKPGQDSNTEEI